MLSFLSREGGVSVLWGGTTRRPRLPKRGGVGAIATEDFLRIRAAEMDLLAERRAVAAVGSYT